MSEAMTTQGEEVLELTKVSFDDLARRANTIEAPEVVDKEEMLGREFIIIDASVRKGDMSAFVSLVCLLRDRSQVVINDGSTGIFKQVTGMNPSEWEALEEDPTLTLSLPIYCKKGLRKSSYVNEHGKGTTYYLTGGKFA